MHSFGVVESAVLPGTDIARPVVVASADHLPDPRRRVAPTRASGPDADTSATAIASSVADLASLRGPAFLDRLASFDPSALRVAAADAGVVGVTQDTPPSVAAVQTWWGSLSDIRRATIAARCPELVGNLDGVPYAVRDQANRTVLRAGLDRAAGGASADASAAAMLGQVDESLRATPGDPRRWLLTLDTRGAGRAAISVGDLGTARDITVVVPGMFFTVTGQMADFTNTANDLYLEQATLAGVAQQADGGDGSGVAVVAWMGYRTPNLANILSLDLARRGAVRLEHEIVGIRAMRTDEPRVAVVAHSYGSTTAMTALSSGRVHVDSLTMIGSPGSDVRSASELAVTAGQVFVGSAHGDPIAGSGYFGTDPGSSAFGSTVLDLAGGATGSAGDRFRSPFGHNEYLKPGTASLHDVALIAVGRGDLVRADAERRRNGDGRPARGTPDFLLVRPQDLQPRD